MHIHSCCLSKGMLVYLCLCVCMRACEHTIKTVSRTFALSLSLSFVHSVALSLSRSPSLSLSLSLAPLARAVA